MSAPGLMGRHFGSGPNRSSSSTRRQDEFRPPKRVSQTSKHSDLPIRQPAAILTLLCTVLVLSGLALAGVTASISGTVKDGTGAVVAQATVTATNAETGIIETRRTNEQGFYSFQSLPLGHYEVEVQQTGFTGARRTGLVLDVNSALVADFGLQVGQVKEMVTVSTDAVQVDTATTHLGEVIGSNQMTGVPLVSRSYTDLLALQPGVAPVSSGLTGGGAGASGGSPLIAAGFAVPLVSGDLNAGNFSVNGMREGSNGFLLNGATVQEFGFSGTSVVPNLDSIAEFRILTNNFDAEYGNYSGGQVNVITKSGSNEWHGNAFEFLRNTNLDARNYFDPVGQKGAYHQNQFGGTIGGPVKKNKIFFFADYQGNRKVVGVTQKVTLPTAAMRNGDFSAIADQLASANKTVQGPLWATQLSNKLGYAVTQGEPYYTAGCVTSAACVFPNAQIPSSIFATPANNLLSYIPIPGPDGTFSTSGSSQRLNDNKVSGRMDANTRFGMLSAYYLLDTYTLNNPYPTASVPGFNALGTGRTQVINLGATKTLGNTAVNEFRYQFIRVNDSLNKPSGGKGVTLSSLGFVTGGNTGIVALAPGVEGVPEVDFNNFAIGVPSRVLGLVENTHQWIDNFSKVVGTHTLKFGGSYRYTQMGEYLSNVMNGQFQFFGGETGNDFADFLIGAPNFYVQGQAPPSLGRSRYGGAYAQDSWRARSNLTINYGVRWEFSTPWYEKNNNLETLVPGLQSKVFPGAPTGWVFPGDPGIPRTLAPTRYNNFAPRLGMAYSPNFSNGFLSKLTGGPGQTSIRVGWGMFYTSFEGATNFNEIGDPPYGYYYVGTAPSFTEPFLDRGTGNPQNQRFPVTFPPNGVSASNPYTLDWSKFLPIGSSPGFWHKNRLPYAEDYELSIQRQFRGNTLLTVSYVGTQAHRLLSTVESNPGDPALCLSLSQPSQVAPGTPTCGPSGENTVYTRADGTVVNGTRAPFGNNFGSNGYFMTIGQSGYNSLQVNVRHTSSRMQFLVGYTWSKSLDNSSGYGEQVNPFNPKSSMALSAFDVTHNFVFSYNYRLPFDKLGGPKRLMNGWQLSGVTRFTTGIPVYLYDTIDTSLLGTAYTGPITLGIDTPSFNGTTIHTTDPRTGQPFFNVGDFSEATLGQLGTARRRFFHGPGINNWDMALLKDTGITERIKLQFRAEFFNVFNHAQFNNPNGNFRGAFGTVQSARDPRIGQISLKLLF